MDDDERYVKSRIRNENAQLVAIILKSIYEFERWLRTEHPDFYRRVSGKVQQLWSWIKRN